MKERERQVNCGEKDIIITEPMSIQFHDPSARAEECTLERFIGNFTFPHFH